MRLSPVLLSVLLAACGERGALPYYQGTTGDVGPLQIGAAFRADGGAENGSAPRSSSYPKGPYGEENPSPGEKLPNLRLYGLRGEGRFHVGPRGALGELTVADLRRTDRTHLILHVGAIWCSASHRSAEDLGDYAGQLDEAGALVVSALIDGRAAGVEPTRAELEEWQQILGVSLPVLTGDDEQFRRVLPGYEHAYIIRLDTMVVEWHGSGASPEQSIAAAVARAFLSMSLD